MPLCGSRSRFYLVVLKLSLYGFLRLVLPLLPVATLLFTPFVFMICVITIIYASLSTLRTIDVKEIIAYSSVAHAAVYLLGVFSNTIVGIEGAIVLGLGHGFASSALFIVVGGILYDRTHTRLISYYRGLAQIMPVLALLFFILSLANAGTPLTLNFVGEFLSLYGAFERSPILGALACSSVVFSAAYTFFMYNRIVFGGALSSFFAVNVPDLNKREFVLLISLVIPTILFGIYPSPILDGLHYSVSTLIYSCDLLLFFPILGLKKQKVKPFSRNFSTGSLVPVVTYENAAAEKVRILKENNNKSGVYIWRNKINGKKYIGSGTVLKKRFQFYFSEAAMKAALKKSRIYSAILKHGLSNFSLAIIEYCPGEECIEKENFYNPMPNIQYIT